MTPAAAAEDGHGPGTNLDYLAASSTCTPRTTARSGASQDRPDQTDNDNPSASGTYFVQAGSIGGGAADVFTDVSLNIVLHDSQIERTAATQERVLPVSSDDLTYKAVPLTYAPLSKNQNGYVKTTASARLAAKYVRFTLTPATRNSPGPR
jgi:hypothetical protein